MPNLTDIINPGYAESPDITNPDKDQITGYHNPEYLHFTGHRKSGGDYTIRTSKIRSTLHYPDFVTNPVNYNFNIRNKLSNPDLRFRIQYITRKK